MSYLLNLSPSSTSLSCIFCLLLMRYSLGSFQISCFRIVSIVLCVSTAFYLFSFIYPFKHHYYSIQKEIAQNASQNYPNHKNNSIIVRTTRNLHIFFQLKLSYFSHKCTVLSSKSSEELVPILNRSSQLFLYFNSFHNLEISIFYFQLERQFEHLIGEFEPAFLISYPNPFYSLYSILQQYQMNSQQYCYYVPYNVNLALSLYNTCLSWSFPTFPMQYLPYQDNCNIYEEKEFPTLSEQLPMVKCEESPSIAHSLEKFSRFKYAKKNVESNVVNQVISYITTKSKSYGILLKILKDEEKVQTFYQIMREGRKKTAKYMGRSVLQNLIELDEDHSVYIQHRKVKSMITLKMNDIRKAVRLLTSHFLRTLIIPTLLTSSKLDKKTIKQHLTRARQILVFINKKPNTHSL